MVINKKLLDKSFLDNMLIFLFFDIIVIFPLFNRLESLNIGIGLINALQIYVLIFTSLFLFLNKNFKNIIEIIKEIKPFAYYAIYIFFSLTIYFLFSNLSVVNYFREIFYSILPLSMLLLGIGLNKYQRKLYLKTIIYSIFFLSIFTLLASFNVIKSDFYNSIFGNNSLNFSGLYGPIIYGYISQLCISILFLYPEKLFSKIIKYSLISYFFIICVLTLQRAPLIGLMLTLLIVILKNFKNFYFNKDNIFKLTVLILSLSIIIIFIAILIPTSFYLYKIDFLNIDIFRIKIILDELTNFSLKEVLEGRVNQAIIFSDAVFYDFFGMGFGRFSKLNDFNIAFAQPDASYYRLFNEIGFIGLVTFFYSHLSNLFKDKITLNYLFRFQIIIFTLFAFFFNRILWTSPCGFLFYFLIGTSISLENNQNLNFKSKS